MTKFEKLNPDSKDRLSMLDRPDEVSRDNFIRMKGHKLHIDGLAIGQKYQFTAYNADDLFVLPQTNIYRFGAIPLAIAKLGRFSSDYSMAVFQYPGQDSNINELSILMALFDSQDFMIHSEGLPSDMRSMNNWEGISDADLGILLEWATRSFRGTGDLWQKGYLHGGPPPSPDQETVESAARSVVSARERIAR